MIKADNMIMIGSFGQNSGKTALAEVLIKKWKARYPIIGLKVTKINEHEGSRTCPRGEEGCGVCTGITSDYELCRETQACGDKDTSRLLAAGANAVYWLRSLDSALVTGFQEFKSIADTEGSLIICESNSLREYVEPGAFMMMRNVSNTQGKPSSMRVLKYADTLIVNHFEVGDLEKAVEGIDVGCTDGAIKVHFRFR